MGGGVKGGARRGVLCSSLSCRSLCSVSWSSSSRRNAFVTSVHLTAPCPPAAPQGNVVRCEMFVVDATAMSLHEASVNCHGNVAFAGSRSISCSAVQRMSGSRPPDIWLRDSQRICSAGRFSSGSGPDSPQSSSCSSSSAVLHTAASPNIADCRAPRGQPLVASPRA